jgi:branched-chain amino acid transport system substrate-binding protein
MRRYPAVCFRRVGPAIYDCAEPLQNVIPGPMKCQFLSAVFLGVALATTALAQDTIKIGEFGSLTGDNASFGISQNNGVQLAVQEINDAGGVLGKKVDLIVEDNQTKQGETTTIVRKLISQDHVIALIGEVASSKSLEAAPSPRPRRSRKLPPRRRIPGLRRQAITSLGSVLQTIFRRW